MHFALAMIDINQCGLHLLIRFSIILSLLCNDSNLNLVAAKVSDVKSVRDVVRSKVWDHIAKSRDNRITVDYGDSFSNRKLEQRKNAFSNLRIRFEISQLERQIATSSVPNAKAKGELLIETILPRVAEIWSNALSVRPADKIVFDKSTVCQPLEFTVPHEWVKSGGFSGVDIVIFVGAFEDIDTEVICDETVLAFAETCSLDQNGRPVIGFINFCLDSIILQNNGTALDSDIKYFEDIALHEVAHVLGLNSLFLKYFRNPVTNEPLLAEPFRTEEVKCIDGKTIYFNGLPRTNVLQYKESQETGYYEIVTPTVRQVARNQFACQSITGARLENQPSNSADCFGSHLDERFFLTDLMSAFYDISAGYFSPMTLAVFEDSGHYIANYDISQNSPFGLAAGCDFIDGKCIVDDSVPDYGKGYFCDNVSEYISETDFGDSTWQCDPTHSERGHCDLYEFKSRVSSPYFKDKTLGPAFLQGADHCPTIQINKVACIDEGEIPLNDLEVFGSNSRCMDVRIDGSDSAMCLEAICNKNKRSYDFTVGQDIYTCEEGVQELRIGDLTIQCPRLAAVCPDMFCPSMCSGKGICDWSLSVPFCKCFDDTDTTPNCNDSLPVAPDKLNSSTYGSKIELSFFTLQFIFLTCLIY